MNEINKTNDSTLTPLESIAVRGLEAQQLILQKEIEEAARKLDESRALVYAEIETRLKLPAGSILSGSAKIEGDSIVWKPVKKKRSK